jgi:cell division protease FtsH
MQFPPNNDKKNDKKGSEPPSMFPFPNWVLQLVIFGVLIFVVIALLSSGTTLRGQSISYSFFVNQVEQGNVSRVTFEGATIIGQFKEGVSVPDGPDRVTSFNTILPPVEDRALISLLRSQNVLIESNTSAMWILPAVLNFAAFAFFIVLAIWLLRRTQRQMGGVLGFGQTQAREYTADRPQVTFADVAGQDAAKGELVEVVDFLKEPDKYIALGARIPRGVLLIGPPGMGKTLMARAVAGEAKVSFLSIAASEFVEMFVGVGASRVRDLFKKARDAAPAIVFVDEIDAVGRQRGTGLGGGNDEREQTLNQLLSEMDGFDQSETVIIMAATNRPDVLDPALTRPGRFDRQVTVGSPDRKGRLEILKIHTRGKPVAEDVDLEAVSRTTIGFSGADLANLCNEAALAAARKNHKRITSRDFADAFDRIILGTERPPLSDPHERKVVAYHEAGHALVATYLPDADPVSKLTMVPRGRAAGVTVYMPEDDKYVRPREYWEAMMVSALGGRAAEEVAFGTITTGAEGDLRQVTAVARRMVANWGMSDKFGLLNFGDDERQPFLGYSISQGRSYSDATAAEIDREVRALVEAAHKEALRILGEKRTQLDRLAEELLDSEVVERPRLLEIAGINPAAAKTTGDR